MKFLKINIKTASSAAAEVRTYWWSISGQGWCCTSPWLQLLHWSSCSPGTTAGRPCCLCLRCSIPPWRCGRTGRRCAACGRWRPRRRCGPWSAVACRSETPEAVGRLPAERLGSLRRPLHWTSCRSPRLDSKYLWLKKALCALGSTTWFRKQVDFCVGADQPCCCIGSLLGGCLRKRVLVVRLRSYWSPWRRRRAQGALSPGLLEPGARFTTNTVGGAKLLKQQTIVIDIFRGGNS